MAKNPGWEEAADHTGKAPEHVIAANKCKTNDISRAPMYKPPVVVQRLIHEMQGFNPFFINVGGHSYQLKDIIIYKQNGELITNGRGWFGSNNSLDFFEIPETTKRMKVKLDGTTFIVSVKPESYERRPLNKYAILYIPYEYFDFEYKLVNTRWEAGMTISTPTHISRKFKMDERGTPLMVEEHQKAVTNTSAEAERMKKEIMMLECQLANKKQALQRL